jgi:hypothetical protein
VVLVLVDYLEMADHLIIARVAADLDQEAAVAPATITSYQRPVLMHVALVVTLDLWFTMRKAAAEVNLAACGKVVVV